MEQYARYKPSGVEWIGEIPYHWKLKRLKFTSIINPSKNELARFPKSLEVSFYPMEAIGFGTLNHGDEKTLESVGNGFTYFRDGDILVAKITPSFENGKGALATGLKNGIGFGTTEIHVIRPLKNLNKHFLYYITYSHNFRHVGAGTMEGTAGQKRVPSDFLVNHEIVIPSPEEQTAIANYLDEKTAQIDSLMKKKKKLIELLKEERTAMINQAVTRGIDPNVKLKPSGVDWLGNIPEHWAVKKLKYLAKIVLGKMLTNNNRGDDYLKPYLRAANLQWIKVDVTDVKEMWFSQDETEKLRLKKYDLLVSEGGEVGRTCIWRKELDECYIQNSVHKITIEQGYNPLFFLYQFFYLGSIGYFESIVNRISIAHLTWEKIRDIFVWFPDTQEQNRILEFIETETKRIDSTISKIEKEIELLQEYRTALISEVVTGKIKVI